MTKKICSHIKLFSRIPLNEHLSLSEDTFSFKINCINYISRSITLLARKWCVDNACQKALPSCTSLVLEFGLPCKPTSLFIRKQRTPIIFSCALTTSISKIDAPVYLWPQFSVTITNYSEIIGWIDLCLKSICVVLLVWANSHKKLSHAFFCGYNCLMLSKALPPSPCWCVYTKG